MSGTVKLTEIMAEKDRRIAMLEKKIDLYQRNKESNQNFKYREDISSLDAARAKAEALEDENAELVVKLHAERDVVKELEAKNFQFRRMMADMADELEEAQERIKELAGDE